MSILSFPLFEIKLSPALPEEIILLPLGGRRVPSWWLSALDFYTSVWAIDSGVELCREAGITPDRLIGDRDSAAADAWEWAVDSGAEVYSYESEKDLTDFQIALEMLTLEAETGRKGVFLTGAFGGRFDHLFSLINSFTEWSDKYLPIGIADHKETLFFLSGGCEAEIKFHARPEAVSLIPFRDSGGVSIGNVRWPLERVSLERSKPYSISNRADEGNLVTASAGDGLVGLYCSWDCPEK